MESKQLVDRVYGYFERKFIGLLTIIAGFAGLLLAESATRWRAPTPTYYQEHSLPRFVGACLAFALSYTVVWLARWSKDEIRTPYFSLPSKKDRERVGLLCYTPYVLFIFCVIVAFVDV